ncbi:hypothetical protein MGMO_45c00420 [Methyloglobulus morosus KoM1]|uniref:Uncharacterized protein n=1 Tax=Methyloglobulus morosus KoM1 TaxID=1116472 RepID=V5BHM4_9GAMM|nr:hypothetical protein [Methyloglobulus morosus]ESS72810.1 hypothetical protein MGMO_45c00420 [Methyloglobulus morosus KoM1]
MPYLEHHWQLPKGFIDKNQKNPFNFTREEWNKSLRTDKHPEKIIIQLQECWFIFDSRKAFEQALYDGGYALVRDDKRGYVAVDSHGEVSRVLAQTRPDSYRIFRVSVSLGLVQFFFIPNQFPTEQGFH